VYENTQNYNEWNVQFWMLYNEELCNTLGPTGHLCRYGSEVNNITKG
jgi:hypothetical protein